MILPCRVASLKPPKITWLLNGHEINTPSETNTSELIFQAKDSDTGIYECHAVNETGGNEFQQTVLVVYGTPTIYPANDEVVRVTSNSDIILKCQATGFPFVSFFCFRSTKCCSFF